MSSSLHKYFCGWTELCLVSAQQPPTRLNCCELEISSWDKWAVSTLKHSFHPGWRLRNICLVFAWVDRGKALIEDIACSRGETVWAPHQTKKTTSVDFSMWSQEGPGKEFSFERVLKLWRKDTVLPSLCSQNWTSHVLCLSRAAPKCLIPAHICCLFIMNICYLQPPAI